MHRALIDDVILAESVASASLKFNVNMDLDLTNNLHKLL